MPEVTYNDADAAVFRDNIKLRWAVMDSITDLMTPKSMMAAIKKNLPKGMEALNGDESTRSTARVAEAMVEAIMSEHTRYMDLTANKTPEEVRAMFPLGFDYGILMALISFVRMLYFGVANQQTALLFGQMIAGEIKNGAELMQMILPQVVVSELAGLSEAQIDQHLVQLIKSVRKASSI